MYKEYMKKKTGSAGRRIQKEICAAICLHIAMQSEDDIEYGIYNLHRDLKLNRVRSKYFVECYKNIKTQLHIEDSDPLDVLCRHVRDCCRQLEKSQKNTNVEETLDKIQNWFASASWFRHQSLSYACAWICITNAATVHIDDVTVCGPCKETIMKAISSIKKDTDMQEATA
jgi:hypothetical protein